MKETRKSQWAGPGAALTVLVAVMLGAGCSSETKPGSQPGAGLESSRGTGGAVPVETVSFNTHVRPILSDRCFACHGPDSKNQESPLRLDSQEASRRNLSAEGEPPRYGIVPGKPEESEILARILHADPVLRMPPVAAKKKAITDEEAAILRQWILEGAAYEKHWAYVPPVSPRPPEVKQAKPFFNNIDRFVAAKLEARQLQANGEAAPATLLRRVTLTLTGLSPTPEEAEAYLGDTDPGRYEKTVDRLLKTPAFAERLAVDWMDAARYADSYGYQQDVPRQVWPWRDWVLNAFRTNMPYDRFITHQLAGDLIEAPTQESRIATAFNRLHMQKGEGGSIPEEFRVEYVADRAQTASTVFMGLTMECARCHDHKFDPISQEDYFKTFALFNSIDESGIYSFFTRAVPSPSMPVLNTEEIKQLAEKTAALNDARAAAEQSRRDAETGFKTWHESWNQRVDVGPAVSTFNFEEADGSLLVNGVKPHHDGRMNPAYSRRVEGFRGQGIQVDGDDAVILGNNGPFQRHAPISMSLRVKLPKRYEHAFVFGRSRGSQDAGSRGYELLMDQGRLNFAMVHFHPGNEIRIRSREPVPLNRWLQVTLTYDGSSSADGLKLYLDGEALDTEVLKDHLTKEIYFAKPEWDENGMATDKNSPVQFGARSRDTGTAGAIVDDVALFSHCLSPLQVRELFAPGATPRDEPELFAYYLARHDSGYRAAQDALAAKRLALNEFMNSRFHLMVMKELPEPKPTYVLERGLYNEPNPDRKVEPGPPDWIHPFDAQYTQDRLGLAKWLTHPDHPLTARVTVNRFWQMIFGRGLVHTANDFGAQGAYPTHPDLLDHLARFFIDSGWDVRALFKHIVMSETFRRDSNASPALLQKDPQNEFLARGPANAMTAEMLRDSALQAAGLLSAAVGGASVSPDTPHRDRYRRSLYTKWMRNNPSPDMLLFGAPRRQVCTVQREKTLTPLQPLVLMNSPQFVEASRALATRTLEEAPDDADRIQKLFLRMTGRMPAPGEVEALTHLLAEQRDYFTSEPDAAEKLTAVGKVQVDEKTAEAYAHREIAAWTMVANTVMNMDAFYMIR